MSATQRRKRILSTKDTERDEIIGQIKFYVWKKKWDTALVIINDYLKDNPTDYYVLIFKAMVLPKLEQPEEAMEIYESLLDKKLTKRNQIFAYTQYAQLLSETNKIDLAIEYYLKAINMSDLPETAARGKVAYLYCTKREYETALDILDVPGYNSDFLNVKRAYVFCKQKKFYQAMREINKKTYNDYDYDEREIFNKRVIEQEKNFTIGFAYYKVGKLFEALSYLSKATFRINKIFFEANILICEIYMMIGNIDEAITLIDEVMKKNPSNHYIRAFSDLKAEAYIKKNDYKSAEILYKTIVTTDDRKNIFFGKLELLKGNFEKAEEYFSCFDINKEDICERFDEFYRLALIKFRLKKYDEAQYIIDMFKSNESCYEVSRILYELKRLELCIKKLKGENFVDRDLTYSEKQILSYSEQEAIKHIKDHHSDNPTVSKFYDDIDIDNLFYEVKDLLTKENIIYDSALDKYIIKYNKVGTNLDNGNIHQLRVLTLPNTKNIITMYPYEGTDSEFNIEEEPEKEKPKVKRLSQIEKFNMRYGNKA